MSIANHPRAYWRGGLTCVRAIAMLTGMVALLILQGHAGIAAGIALVQGSYRPWSKYSANTHAGCGVVDISRFNSVTGKLWTQAEWAIIVAAARQVGFAAWHRFAIKDLWVEHTHCVAIGCPDLNVPDATDQVAEYHQGFDGLMGNDRDNGPRDWVNVTWERYSATTTTKPTTQEDDMTMLRWAGRGSVWTGSLETGACWGVKGGPAGSEQADYDTMLRAVPGVRDMGNVGNRMHDLLRMYCANTRASLAGAAVTAAIPSDILLRFTHAGSVYAASPLTGVFYGVGDDSLLLNGFVPNVTDKGAVDDATFTKIQNLCAEARASIKGV